VIARNRKSKPKIYPEQPPNWWLFYCPKQLHDFLKNQFHNA
jgi:hypothetical protein